jgi:hypothetical protein
MSLQRLAQDHPVLVADGTTVQVQSHQALVIGECPVQDSLLGIICSQIKIWSEFRHTAVTCQSTRDNLTVNAAPIQIDWASVALKGLGKGDCCIVHQATTAYTDLHIKS